MQNIHEPSSHCPEQNLSFYCTEEATDFPYTPPLCSDSVYSWVLTGLPQAALQACCSPHNLHAYKSSKSKGKMYNVHNSGLWDRRQELWTWFIFCIRFSIIENATAKNFDSMVLLLDIHQTPERAPSHFHSAQGGKFCKAADKVSAFLTQWKPSRSFKGTESVAWQVNPGEGSRHWRI